MLTIRNKLTMIGFKLSVILSGLFGGSFYTDSGKLDLGLLRNNFEQRPPQPISVAVFDEVKTDLESFISEVPSAITTERRYRLIITTTDNWRTEELLAQMKALAEKH